MDASATVNGEGSSRSRTLGDAMRDPSKIPDVVVLDRIPHGLNPKEVLDPKEDLWLTTADGRYSSPIIPIRVGTAPSLEVFHVHKDVLLKAKWFRAALCGGFMEATAQSLDLPEEDPAIFHFLVAYLYEERYVATKPLASVLIPDEEKGKGREGVNDAADSDSDSSSASFLSDSSARSRRNHQRRRRREERAAERLRQKHPGSHRHGCSCPTCQNANGPPCWSCAAPRMPPMPAPAPPPPMHPARSHRNHHHRRRGPDGRRASSPPPSASAGAGAGPPARINGEDMRTWLMAYELNVDVYICADRYLLDDFKDKVARATIDMLETAGPDAAQVAVLELCGKLYAGVGDGDALLKMVFARVGFLQDALWKKAPAETSRFLVGNPEVAALMLKETATRGAEDLRARIPSMERSSGYYWPGPGPLMGPAAYHHQHYRGHPRPPRVFYN